MLVCSDPLKSSLATVVTAMIDASLRPVLWAVFKFQVPRAKKYSTVVQGSLNMMSQSRTTAGYAMWRLDIEKGCGCSEVGILRMLLCSGRC